MSNLIIVTVGTSALEKDGWKKAVGVERLDLDSIERNLSAAADTLLYDNIKTNLVQILQASYNDWQEDPTLPRFRKLSAEMATLLRMQEKGALFQEDDIFLLHTDTFIGKLAAEINKEMIKTCFPTCKVETELMKNIRVIPNNSEDDIARDFREAGLNHLKDILKKISGEKCRTKQWFVVTGGYKCLLLFAPILATWFKLDIYYLYEMSNELIFLQNSFWTEYIYRDSDADIVVSEEDEFDKH